MLGQKGLKPLDLIITAKELVGKPGGKPRQSNLKRALSTAYYALFHTLARCCADVVIGTNSQTRKAWQQVYRALDHNFAKNACQHGNISRFPQEIQDFANAFVTLQSKRHSADYDPYSKIYKSQVLVDLANAETVIGGFESAPAKHRRAFAAWVLLKQRP